MWGGGIVWNKENDKRLGRDILLCSKYEATISAESGPTELLLAMKGFEKSCCHDVRLLHYGNPTWTVRLSEGLTSSCFTL